MSAIGASRSGVDASMAGVARRAHPRDASTSRLATPDAAEDASPTPSADTSLRRTRRHADTPTRRHVSSPPLSARLIASINWRSRPKFRRCGPATKRGKRYSSGSFFSCFRALPIRRGAASNKSENDLLRSSIAPVLSCSFNRMTRSEPTHRYEWKFR